MGGRKSKPSGQSGQSVDRIIRQKNNELQNQQKAYEELSAYNRALQEKINDASRSVQTSNLRFK